MLLQYVYLKQQSLNSAQQPYVQCILHRCVLYSMWHSIVMMLNEKFWSPLSEQWLLLLFDIWQKEQLFNMDYSSAVWSSTQMSPQQCLWLGSSVCLSAALRGKELAIITTSNVAFRKIQTLCSSAFASQIIIITVLLGSKEINENLGFPHRCNSVLSTLTHDVLKISCKRRLMLSVCELLQPHMIASGDWWIEQNCGHKENIKSVYLTCRLPPTHICNQWPAIHKKPKSPWCLISS